LLPSLATSRQAPVSSLHKHEKTVCGQTCRDYAQHPCPVGLVGEGLQCSVKSMSLVRIRVNGGIY
jgi:hypothetical protein